VAHNARFDLSFLRAELERACDVVFRPPLLCTVRLSRVLVPELRRRNLDSVIDWFGITTDRATAPPATPSPRPRCWVACWAARASGASAPGRN
jgi:hypothetical protein